jgi:phosphatidylinositol alpha-1,6-mannosyltransferase
VPPPSAEHAVPRSLFITNDFPPRIGGAQSWFWGLINTLDPADVVVLAPAHPDAKAFDATHPYRVVRAASSVLWPTPALIRQAAALIEENDLELVQLGHPLPAGLMGPALRKRTGRPYIIFLGGAEVTLPAKLPVVGSLLRYVLRRAALLVSTSEYTAAKTRRQTAGRAPVQVSRPALDLDAFALRGPGDADAAKAAFGVNGPLVVCVGRLVPRKGQDKLLDALTPLSAEFADLNLALVGSGRLERRLRRRARRRGLEGRVHMPGAVSNTELHRWLVAAEVFASPCRTRWAGLEVEGYGLVFAEATLVGVPVIGGDSGGAPEFVKTGETGILVDGHSTDEIVAALAELLRLSPAERLERALAGRELALAYHDPALVAERYRAVLARAVGR